MTPREALKRIIRLANVTDDDIGWDWNVAVAEKVRQVAREALAEPERNCERFDNWDDAEAKYQKLVKEGKVEDGTWCEWLWDFAKEGGAS